MKRLRETTADHYGRFKIVTETNGSTLFQRMKTAYRVEAWGTIASCKQDIIVALPTVHDLYDFICSLLECDGFEKSLEIIELWLTTHAEMSDYNRKQIGELRLKSQADNLSDEAKIEAIKRFVYLLQLPF